MFFMSFVMGSLSFDSQEAQEGGGPHTSITAENGLLEEIQNRYGLTACFFSGKK